MRNILTFLTLRRAIKAILPYFFVSVILFSLTAFNPIGGVYGSHLGRGADRALTSAQVQTIRDTVGADQPLPVQYALWLKNIATGDYGNSGITRQPALSSMRDRFLPTLLLIIPAYLLYLSLSVLLQTFLADRDGKARTLTFTTLRYLGFLPLILIVTGEFYVDVRAVIGTGQSAFAFPLGGMIDTPRWGTSFGTPAFWNDVLPHHFWEVVGDITRHLSLPIFALTLSAFALLGYRRPSPQEATQRLTAGARAKGALLREGMRLAPAFSWLMAGAVVVEAFFNLPGMALFFVRALASYDYPVIFASLGVLTLIALLLMSVSSLVRVLARDPASPEALVIPADFMGATGESTYVAQNIRIYWERLRSQKLAWIGVGILTLLALMALLAPILTPNITANTFNLTLPFTSNPPTLEHGLTGIFGYTEADDLNRSVFALVTFGLRNTLAIALLVSLLSILIGTTIAAIATRVGGWFDTLLITLAEGVMVIPTLPLIMVVLVLYTKAELSLMMLVMTLSLINWAIVTLVVRAHYRQKGLSGDFKTIIRGTLPAIPTLVFLMTGNVIVTESILGRFALSLPFPPQATLGNASANALSSLFGTNNWWWTFIPLIVVALAKIATVLVSFATEQLLGRENAVIDVSVRVEAEMSSGAN